jgi:hypothetical protein
LAREKLDLNGHKLFLRPEELSIDETEDSPPFGENQLREKGMPPLA